MMPDQREQTPGFGEAARVWWKIGWITFGGSAAHIAIMHEEIVEKRRWVSESTFLHALSHCMLLPGPEAQQLAIYLGWKMHGRKGGLVSGMLFVLPSMFILLALSILYVRFGNLPWIAAAFRGLKPAVVALVINALLRIAGRALRGPVYWTFAAASLLAMLLFNVSVLWIMLAAVCLGLLLNRFWPQLLAHQPNAEAIEPAVANGKARASITFRSIAGLCAVMCVLWLSPLVLLRIFGVNLHFWSGLATFFTRTTCITFGGAYAVLPYVAQVTVTKLHWLSKSQMLDGFALAETTPGPLIIVLAFVGFMAAYNAFQQSLWMGTLGLLLTTFYTFLPCFLFVFAGAPLVERSHGKRSVEAVLGLITAVVVGAIANLTVFLSKGVLFPEGTITWSGLDYLALVWIAVSLLLLRWLKGNVLMLVAISIVFGLARLLFIHV